MKPFNAVKQLHMMVCKMLKVLDKYWGWIVFLLGLYLILDGAGSMIVYKDQPFIFDQLIRLIRMFAGLIIAYAMWYKL